MSEATDAIRAATVDERDAGLVKPCQGSDEPHRPLAVTVVCPRSDEDHVIAQASVVRSAGNEVRILGLDMSTGERSSNVPPSLRTRLLRKYLGDGALSRLSSFADALRNDDSELWHVHYACGYHAFLAGALKSRPMVISTMGADIFFDEQGGVSWLERLLTRIALRTADLVTVKAEHSAERIRAYGVSEKRIVKVVWGVDTTFYSPMSRREARRAVGLTHSGPLILSVRQLKSLYNIDIVVRAFEPVARRFEDVQLAIMRHGADRDYEERIRELVRSLGLETRVLFVDSVEPGRMPLWYGASDVCVGIPQSDALPQTLLEAMACGRVTICPDDSRYDEFAVDRTTAFRVERAPPAVARAMMDALQAPDARQRMEEAARELILQRADSSRIAVEVDGFLRRAAASGSTPKGGLLLLLARRGLLSLGTWLVALTPGFGVAWRRMQSGRRGSR